MSDGLSRWTRCEPHKMGDIVCTERCGQYMTTHTTVMGSMDNKHHDMPGTHNDNMLLLAISCSHANKDDLTLENPKQMKMKYHFYAFKHNIYFVIHIIA